MKGGYMEIRRENGNIGYSMSGICEDPDYFSLRRFLRPSRLHEAIIFKRKKNKRAVYFIIAYGEVKISKIKVEDIENKKFNKMFNRFMKLSNEKKHKEFVKYLDNKFYEYEKKVFDIKLKASRE